ncbi:MAG: methionine--tRNA ligase subunit beta [Parachlamydiales bacterium]|jgi:methionyl-tRNA synthetase
MADDWIETILDKQLFKDLIKLDIPEGKRLENPKVVFAKVEDEVIDLEIEKLKGKIMTEENLPAISYEPLKEEITYDVFDKLDLRVGLIKHAQKVEKSSKLLKLEVDLGFEKRQIISGISKSFIPEQLIGKKVIVVCNLKPAKIMGLESQGMILAAGISDDKLELPFIVSQEPGTIIS